ncbi:MAG: indole-3-glycerol phosphate synthase TrpC [Terriglobales bacterium]
MLSSPANLPSVLEQIVRLRRNHVAAAEQRLPLLQIQKQLHDHPPQRRDFVAGLRCARQPAVIAELKRASPSRGRMREAFSVPALALAYQTAGARALSVLTEEPHFDGRLDYLQAARQATTLPILRKDFIFSLYQVWESAWAGADAILLIAALLDEGSLRQLVDIARQAGLATLCEVHSREELERARAAEPDCIGVNNRDLRSLTVDLRVAAELGPELPAAALGVAESGLRTPADLARMATAGFDAFLIGEGFMQAPDPGAALAQLLAGCRFPEVKICGLTRLSDAQAACAAGASALGFVFAPSPRRASVEQVRAWAAELPTEVLRVGVFAGAPVAEIQAVALACGLHAVQLHGAYTPAEARALTGQVTVWRAVAMPEGAPAALAWASVAERFVLDHAAADGVSGGSGTSFAWESAAQFAHDLAACSPARMRPPSLMVAGGLTPATVGEAVRRSGAGGADVASGVEQQPGIKDHASILAFCRAARRMLRSTAA